MKQIVTQSVTQKNKIREEERNAKQAKISNNEAMRQIATATAASNAAYNAQRARIIQPKSKHSLIKGGRKNRRNKSKKRQTKSRKH